MNGIYLYFINKHLSSWALLELYAILDAEILWRGFRTTLALLFENASSKQSKYPVKISDKILAIVNAKLASIF